MARFILSLLLELDEKDTNEDTNKDSDIEAGTPSGFGTVTFSDTLDNHDGKVDTDEELLFLAAELEKDGGEDFIFEKDDEEMDEDAESDASDNEDINSNVNNSNSSSNHHKDNSGKHYPITLYVGTEACPSPSSLWITRQQVK